MSEEDFHKVFIDVAGESAEIISETKEIEEMVVKRIIYTYTIYDSESQVKTGPFKLSVFSAGETLGFLLE